MKKVSVIIPCYNQSQYIFEAVKSVIDSTYDNIEIIVINDGSDDISSEHLDLLLKDFKGIRIIHQENSGVCKARNRGINEADGEYILPLDADDKIAPTYIEKAVKILDENSDIGIVYCDAEFFGSKQGKWELKPATTKNMLIQNRIFATSMFRKSDFEHIGGYKPEAELGCEDWDLWISFIENGYKTYKIDEILFYYRQHLNTRTADAIKFSKYISIRKNIIKLHRDLYKKYFWQVLFPMTYLVVKNLVYNIVECQKSLLWETKKFIRRIYFKLAINVFNLYPNIKRINKRKLQKEINLFLGQENNETKEIAKDVIVSMTTIPQRMIDIHFAIYSIIKQNIRPEKFILYLGKDKFPNGESDIPQSVTDFKKYGLEFRFVEDIRSFTKLIPALNEFPNKTIITADDDIFYEANWLQSLVETHYKYPNDIITHKHKNIKISSPYKRWTDTAEENASYWNLLMGVGGVLYPPNSLYKNVTDKKLFLNLCKTNDDLWFWAMGVLNNTKIRIADNNNPNQTLINVDRELNLNNDYTLYKLNRITETDIQFKNILNQYPILKELYERKN